MKKFCAALLMAALLSLGLVTTASVSATASACPYSGCIATKTVIRGQGGLQTGKPMMLTFKTEAPGNVAAPTGTVTITVYRVKGGFSVTKTTPYSGGTVRLITAPLTQKGTYNVTATFTPAPGSILAPSNGVSALGRIPKSFTVLDFF